MLKLSNITKVYEKNKRAVDDMTLTVEKGELFGFIGPNGAGKTTTIKMMTGLLHPTFGEITLDQISITQKPVEAKRVFTYVPDHPYVFEGITGNDYVNFMANIYQVDKHMRKELCEKYTKSFEIYDALTQPIHSYSHGMKQKLLITGALIPQPRLILLDEPMVGLDPKSARLLKDIMREHCRKGGTVFFSSHGLEVVENICDRIAIIHHGKLIALGTVEEIKRQNTSLEDIFLEMTNGQ
jgi:ABC-2 type transport system ATP-binding protein